MSGAIGAIGVNFSAWDLPNDLRKTAKEQLKILKISLHDAQQRARQQANQLFIQRLKGHQPRIKKIAERAGVILYKARYALFALPLIYVVGMNMRSGIACTPCDAAPALSPIPVACAAFGASTAVSSLITLLFARCCKSTNSPRVPRATPAPTTPTASAGGSRQLITTPRPPNQGIPEGFSADNPPTILLLRVNNQLMSVFLNPSPQRPIYTSQQEMQEMFRRGTPDLLAPMPLGRPAALGRGLRLPGALQDDDAADTRISDVGTFIFGRGLLHSQGRQPLSPEMVLLRLAQILGRNSWENASS